MWERIAAAVLSGAYGVLILVTGYSMMRVRGGENRRDHPLPAIARQGWVLCGLMLVVACILFLARNGFAVPLTIAGLAAAHALAIYTGLSLNGRLEPSHHLVRFVVSVVLAVLAFRAFSPG